MEEVQKKPMEADQILQDIFGIARKLDEIKVFHNILPFNNTELQFMKVIVLADEAGKRVISSDIARSLGITRSARFADGQKAGGRKDHRGAYRRKTIKRVRTSCFLPPHAPRTNG